MVLTRIDHIIIGLVSDSIFTHELNIQSTCIYCKYIHLLSIKAKPCAYLPMNKFRGFSRNFGELAENAVVRLFRTTAKQKVTSNNIELFGTFDIKIAQTTPLPLPVRSAPREGLLVFKASNFCYRNELRYQNSLSTTHHSPAHKGGAAALG